MIINYLTSKGHSGAEMISWLWDSALLHTPGSVPGMGVQEGTAGSRLPLSQSSVMLVEFTRVPIRHALEMGSPSACCLHQAGDETAFSSAPNECVISSAVGERKRKPGAQCEVCSLVQGMHAVGCQATE